MKNLTDFLNESIGQRLSLRGTNKPYKPEDDPLINLKNSRESRTQELKFQRAKENQIKNFDIFIEMVKDVQKNASEIRNYFDNVYLDNGGDEKNTIDLLTCDIDKFSCNFEMKQDRGVYVSNIIYNDKPFKWSAIYSDTEKVSNTWLGGCALDFKWNDKLNDKMATMIEKQVGKNRYYWLIAYKNKFQLRNYNPERLKTFFNAIKHIVERW